MDKQTLYGGKQRGLGSEKDLITSIRAGKTLIETLRAEAERTEREGDLERVAKIRFGELPEAQSNVEASARRLAEIQAAGALLPEEVDAEMIASVVSRWTGIPVARLLEGERAKLLRMEDTLEQRVVGQRPDSTEAINMPTQVVRAAHMQLRPTPAPSTWRVA